jgi:hypothetical protein
MQAFVHALIRTVAAVLVALAWGVPAHGQEPPRRGAAKAICVRDLIWAWGNPTLTTPGVHTLATFASASPARRAELLGVANVMLADAIPNDDGLADAWTREVASAPRLVWEIGADGNGGPPYVYTQRAAQVRTLVDQYPQIEGLLLDDMSTVAIDAGFKPEHIRQIRGLLDGKYAAVKIWGVLYTMSFERPGIDRYVDELDVINLWTWDAKDIVDLDKNVAHCEKTYPGKPIMLGLYLWDYGGADRRMPMDLLRQQCETALRLAHAGRIQGIVFLTITDDAEAVGWAANWIRQVGDQKLGEPGAALPASPAAASADPQKRPAQTTASSPPATRLSLGDGSRWHFTSGPWTETADGIIRPPDAMSLHSRAFATTESYGDLTAEFEVSTDYREIGSGGAGLIFRAADPTHFYAVYVPWGGQTLAGRHFWVLVVKADGDGTLRSIASVYVPGVPAETNRWYKVRLEAKGSRIEVWVDGRQATSVTDDSYREGAVGMIGYGWYAFRTIDLTGTPRELGPWDRVARVPTHRFQVGLSSEHTPSGCVAPNGDVLLAAGSKVVRSKDKGRTWGAPETLPPKLGNVGDQTNAMLRTAKGRLLVMLYRDRSETRTPVSEISIAESTDNGLTWSDPVPAKVADGWPPFPGQQLYPYGPLVETENGTLLRFFHGEKGVSENWDIWGNAHCKAYAIRSTDAGMSWSAPIELDWSPPVGTGAPRGSISGSLDLTEPTAVAIGNQVMVLLRPIYSQTMWQCWSADAGVSWDSAARATFPGYAQSIVRMQSGAILVAKRFPHYSINVSRDNGLNWDEGTIVDYPVWGMGCAVEVDTDVVLCTYMDGDGGSHTLPLLAQLLRVTPTRIEPLPR